MMAQLPDLSAILQNHLTESPLFADNLLQLTKQQALYVRAAKKVEQEVTNLEVEFFKRLHILEVEFQPRFTEVLEKRKKVIDGSVPVTDADVDEVPLVYSLSAETAQEQIESKLTDDAASKGIPDFWLTVLQNCPHTTDLIEQHDVPILKHLVNLECELTHDGFTLIFTFTPNEYFSNTTLRKTYTLDVRPNTEPPYIFEGPSIASCKSDTIQWLEGKNVTLKTIKKKQKKKGAGHRLVTKQVTQESFFNLFNDIEGGQESDYELGSIFRENIIPHATVIYTGEYVDDDDYEDGEDFDEGDFDGDGSEVEN